jgi:DNA-binding LacI/PurR family transcriptional regulator
MAVIEPPLTTIQVFNKKLGAAAVDLLHQRITLGKSACHTNVLICGALIKRESVQKISPANLTQTANHQTKRRLIMD